MRSVNKALITAGLILLIGGIVLITITPRRPRMDEEAIKERAQMIRSCPGGTLIGRDPISGRLTWSTGWTGGVVAPGIKVNEVCK